MGKVKINIPKDKYAYVLNLFVNSLNFWLVLLRSMTELKQPEVEEVVRDINRLKLATNHLIPMEQREDYLPAKVIVLREGEEATIVK